MICFLKKLFSIVDDIFVHLSAYDEKGLKNIK